MNDRKNPSPANEQVSPVPASVVKTEAPNDGFLYDATLTQVDVARGTLIFQLGDTPHRVTSPHVSFFSQGAVGRLRLPTDRNEFAFHTYADQRLRRAPELDNPQEQRWGWRINERAFLVRTGLLPGRNGNVVHLDAQVLPLEIPQEFITFCEVRGLTPSIVLRAFIADLCEIMNFFVCPREDGYSSSGSDERLYANQYFQRTFGWVDDPEYRAKVRAARRGNKKQG